MYTILIAIVIGLFVAMLFVNLYFRAKVLKLYGVLVSHMKYSIKMASVLIALITAFGAILMYFRAA